MGSLYKRGKIWWIKYYRKGVIYRESTGTTVKAEANHKLKLREGEISSGKIPGVEFEKVAFEELVEDLLRDYRINDRKSIARIKQAIAHLKKEFGGWKVPMITSQSVEEYIDRRLTEGAKNATINRELAALKRMLNLGLRKTPPKVDRVPYIPMLAENNTRKGFFEHPQFLALLNALPEHMHGFVTFAYMSGWRASEVINLTWSQIDLNNRLARLNPLETKNNQGRTLYLNDTLLEAVQAGRTRSKRLCPYVFPNENGTGPISDWRRTWNAACRKAGLGYGYKERRSYVQKWEGKLPAGPTIHDFRRTAVRNITRAGVSDTVAMQISGHRTRSVFDRYNIVNETDIQLGMERTEQYLRAQFGHNLGTLTPFENQKGAAR